MEQFIPTIKKGESVICKDHHKIWNGNGFTGVLTEGKKYASLSDSFLQLGNMEVVEIMDDAGNKHNYGLFRFH